MSQPSLWTLLRKGANSFNATTPLETVERIRKKLQLLFRALTSIAALAASALTALPLLGFLPYGETANALGAIFMVLTAFFATCVHHVCADFRPLNAELDSRCERALTLVTRCPEAAAYRDEVLNTGRELVGFDLDRLETLAETALRKTMQEKAKVAFAAADAEHVASAHRKTMDRNNKLALSFGVVAAGFITLTPFVDGPFLKSVSFALTFASFVATIYTRVLRADLLDLKLPIWFANNSLIERGLAVLDHRGPGAKALVKLNHEGRSATRGDILDALALDQAERIACKALHKVTDGG